MAGASWDPAGDSSILSVIFQMQKQDYWGSSGKDKV